MEILPVLGSMLLACIGIALMRGLDSYVIHPIPFIYINFFLTLGFGLGIGLLTGLAAR
jgi:hypothetical protein